MLRNVVMAAAALALLAGTGARAEKKTKHPSKAHHCMKDGAEIKTTKASGGKEGRTIKRSKTCAKEGGAWELVEKGPATAAK
jgi:hypothetical protein